MLTQAIVQSSTPMTLNVDAIDPAEILILKSITGLSSTPDLTLFTGDFARDGGYYQGRRAGKRNPVFTFKLNPNYTTNIEVSDIRELLYKTFMEPLQTSDAVQVTIKDDRKPDRYFIGYTEKIESEMWSAVQEAQVSMLCTDPYLRSVALTSGTDASGWLSVPLAYDGSADTGLIMSIKVFVATPTIIISMNGQLMTLTFPGGNFSVNDIIDINTTIGSRSIKRNGVDVMAYLTPPTVWPLLNAVSNTLIVGGTVLSDAKAKVMSYSYRSAWWGI